MGGGLDLALACHVRFAATSGHRGAALGLLTGWGGTQRLARLLGPARTLELLATGERVSAPHARRLGLVDALAADPVAEAVTRLRKSSAT